MQPARASASRDEQLVALIDELLRVSEDLVPSGSREALRDARERVREHRLNLVVLGEFKRGKSSLVNALIDRDLLPTGVVPLTSVVTTISFAPSDALVVRLIDGRDVAPPLSELAGYVTEALNPNNERGVESAHLTVDSALLRDGLSIIDTPGVGSIHSHNTAVARGFLPRVDAALCVLDVGQPLSESERDLLVELAQRVPRLFVAVNKADQLSGDELDQAVEFIARALDERVIGGAGELFVVSARSGRGIERLRERIQLLARSEQREVTEPAAAGLARAAAADAQQTCELEATALLLPGEELDRRVRAFRERIVELRVASEDAGDLLEQASTRLGAHLIERRLAEHMAGCRPRLRNALRKRVSALGAIRPSDLARDLDGYVDAAVRGEFELLVASLSAAVEEELIRVEERYASRIVEILTAVSGLAAELFGTAAGEVLPPSGLREPTRLTFKLEDAGQMLDAVIRLGQRRAPGRFGRYLVARAAEERLDAMLDRHAGRLRSELVAASHAALRDYQEDLDATVDAAVATIEDALARAGREQVQGRQRVAQRRAELEQTITRLCELHDAFAAVRGATVEVAPHVA